MACDILCKSGPASTALYGYSDHSNAYIVTYFVHRYGGVLSYEANTYLEHLYCRPDGTIVTPSAVMVSLIGHNLIAIPISLTLCCLIPLHYPLLLYISVHMLA